MWVRVCNQTRSSVSKVLLMVLGHIFADKLLQVGNAGFVIISMLNYYGPVDASIEKPFKAGVTWIRGDRPLTYAGNLRQPTIQNVNFTHLH